MTLIFDVLKNIFDGLYYQGNNINIKEQFLPGVLNDKINKNSVIVRNIKNNIYNQVKTIIGQLQVSNNIVIQLINAPNKPNVSTIPNAQINPSVPIAQLVYNNVNTGYTYLDGYNSTKYDNYNLYDCSSNTFGYINNINKVHNNVNEERNNVNEERNNINKVHNNVNKVHDNVNGGSNEEESVISKLIDFNKDYIKLVLSTLEDNIYNMHQNIFDLEGKDDAQVEINTYHLEMLIYAQFLFKKLEKNVYNPIELNMMFSKILQKINDQMS
jgi:hypothetical protein